MGPKRCDTRLKRPKNKTLASPIYLQNPQQRTLEINKTNKGVGGSAQWCGHRALTQPPSGLGRGSYLPPRPEKSSKFENFSGHRNFFL